MKTKNLRFPVLFASAGALICTVSVARAADASLEVRQDQSTTQKEVINEPSGAERSYTIQSSQPSYQSSYIRRTYPSGPQLDPDAENDRVMHMYQRGKAAAESLDRQIKPDPIVVWPGPMTTESYGMSGNYPSSQFQRYSSTSTFNEPAAAERITTTGTSRHYTTQENVSQVASSTTTAATTTETEAPTATLGAGTTIKGSDLMGMSIRNEQGEKIGEVKDVVVDLKSGRVAYTVVSASSAAGIGDKWLAVPPTVFTRTGTERALTWDIDKEKLQTAPTIDKRNWNAAMQQDYIGTVYSFYGIQGYNQDSNLNEPAGSQKKNDSQFKNDSEKQEKQDQEKKDQSLNDSSSSSLQGQAAGASTQSSEQSEALKSEPEKAASSSADVSKEAAGAQPSSSSSSSSSEPQSSSSSSSAPASSSSSGSSLNEPAGAATSSATSGTETAADPLVNKVQSALKNDASLSGSAQDVRFSMQEDKLVIKGTVKSEDEKNRIMEKVKATAGSTQIDDQLKVSPSSDSENK